MKHIRLKQSLTFSVPQGSCAGPVLYLVYARTVTEVLPGNLEIHRYANDYAIKVSLTGWGRTAGKLTLEAVESSPPDIRKWMNENRLKMNDSKTKFIILETRQQNSKLITSSTDVNNIHNMSKSKSVKYLGAYLDESLTMKYYITEECKTANINLIRIKNVCEYLTQEACNTLMLGLAGYWPPWLWKRTVRQSA